ncbi:craniofacial development protein 2-like [Mytilus edulis]|uniref:craniofacial development protein 2-like n=1 Tax=Mytilus edulis TaxID=6550 RepID=UPI0039F0743B
MDRYSIEILGLREVRWNKGSKMEYISGMTTINTGHTNIYSCNTNATDTHDKGVGFMLTKKAKQSLLEWNPVSSRIITARFDTKFQKTTIIQVYSPTNNADEEE